MICVMSYEWDLDVQLHTCIDTFENERSRYWENRLNAEEWSALNQLRRDADEIAESIRKRAFALQNLGDTPDLNRIHQAYLQEKEAAANRFAELERIAREKLPPNMGEDILQAFRAAIENEEPDPQETTDRPLHLIWESLCTEDARETVGGIRDRVRRIFRLERVIADILGNKPPPESSVEFLSLVSRCYIFGFVPECVMVCRSAMEAAFRHKISDEHCERAGQRRNHFGYDLAARIEAAFDPRNGLLALPVQKRVYDAATRVRLRGKKTIHEQADATKDALGTLRDALSVIDALSCLADPA
jgi:hypothetical protein